MSASSSEAIKMIKERISLSDLARRYIELRSVGSRLVAPCPFHQETKPSFSINDEQGTFYCFGCQASGDIFDFYSRMNGLDFKESLEQLAEDAHVDLSKYRSNTPRSSQPKESGDSKRTMLKIHELAASHYADNLSASDSAPCHEYLQERGLSEEIIKSFRLGWSRSEWGALKNAIQRSGLPEKAAVNCGILAKSTSGNTYDRFRARLMFPIYSLSGQVIAFGGRVLPALAGEDDAKYINSSDSPIYKKGEHLYGLFQARKSISVQKNILLTEGYMDVITLHQFGYTNAVGVLGTALTPEQVKRLSGFSSSLELLFDGDNPGRKAALKACEMFLTRGLSCKVILLPDKEDIDSLLRGAGPEAFEALRTQARDGLDFCCSALRSLSGKEAVEWARRFLQQIELPELFNGYATRLAGALGFTEVQLRSTVLEAKTASKNFTGPSSLPPKVGNSISRDREIMTFAVRYPQRLPDLRNQGVDLLLINPWAKKLWEKLEQYSPDLIFRVLSEKEKVFWTRCRDCEAGAPALDNEAGEFAAITRLVATFQNNSHKDSVAAALRDQSCDYATQREFLRAVAQARGRQGSE